MKIDVSKIVGYEEMSAEDKIKALMEYDVEVPKATDNSDDIIKLKNAVNKASAEASQYKKQLQEKMTADEKKEAERAEHQKAMEEELANLKRDKTISDYVANFVGAGYGKELAQKSAEAVADGDMKTVFDNLKTFLESHDKDIEARLMKDTSKKPNSGNESDAITKEMFDKMSYQERNKLFNDNKELYDELSK